MCEYMINFIHTLKHLPEKYMMNSVLENFTILQVCPTVESVDDIVLVVHNYAYDMKLFFCPRRNLNSVGDYSSSSVGVVCRLSVSNLKDGIFFKRFELEG